MAFLKTSQLYLGKLFEQVEKVPEFLNNYKSYFAVAFFSAAVSGLAVFLTTVPRLEPRLEVFNPPVGDKTVKGTKLASKSAEPVTGKININTAAAGELSTLYNIGPKRAAAIIKYREKKLFKTTAEIKNIDGIGEKTYEKIKDMIVVD